MLVSSRTSPRSNVRRNRRSSCVNRLVKYWFGAVIASVRVGLPANPVRVLVGSQLPLPSAQQWMSALVKSPMALMGVPGVFL